MREWTHQKIEICGPETASQHKNAMDERTPQAVEALLLAHLQLVPSTARRHFPALREDEDLLQTGRIALWRAAQRWDGLRPFPAYARVCIYHAMLDHLRAEQGAHQALEPLRDDLPAPSWEGTVLDGELRDRIRAAWPAGSRERTILLALSASTPKTDIARHLHLSPRQLGRLAKKAWYKVTAGRTTLSA